MPDPYYNPIDPIELGELVREEFRPKTFIRSQIFNKFERNFDNKTYETQIQTGSRKLAPLNDHKSDPAIRERDDYKAILIPMPYSKQAMAFTCKEKFKRKAGRTLFPTDRNSRREMEEQILDDVMQFNWDLDRREEQMSIEVITTGKLVTPRCEIDFEINPDHIIEFDGVTPGQEFWTDPNAKILDANRRLVRQVRRASGLGNINIIFGEAVFDAFLNHQEVRDQLDNRRIVLGNIEPMEMAGARRVGTLTDPAVTLWTYDEYYDDPNSDNLIDMYPADRITIFSGSGRQGFLYGGISNCAAPSRERRYVHTWFNDKRGEHWMSMESSPCPLLGQPNAILTAKVIG